MSVSPAVTSGPSTVQAHVFSGCPVSVVKWTECRRSLGEMTGLRKFSSKKFHTWAPARDHGV